MRFWPLSSPLERSTSVRPATRSTCFEESYAAGSPMGAEEHGGRDRGHAGNAQQVRRLRRAIQRLGHERFDLRDLAGIRLDELDEHRNLVLEHAVRARERQGVLSRLHQLVVARSAQVIAARFAEQLHDLPLRCREQRVRARVLLQYRE